MPNIPPDFSDNNPHNNLPETKNSELELDALDPPPPPPHISLERAPDANLDTMQCLTSLGEFHRHLLAAKLSIPKDLKSANQALVESKVDSLIEKSRALMQRVPLANNPREQYVLAENIAFFTEEAAKELVNFFQGVHLYYHEKAKHMVWPKYVCLMYIHLFRGFKNKLYPLWARTISRQYSFDEQPIYISGMTEFENNIRILFDLPEDKTPGEANLTHVEDSPTDEIGLSVAIPNHVLSGKENLLPTEIGAYRGKAWNPPTSKSKVIPDSWIQEKGEVFSVPKMDLFDFNESVADDPTEESVAIPPARIGMIGDSTVLSQDASPAATPAEISESVRPALLVAAEGQTIQDDGQEELRIPSIFQENLIPDADLDAALNGIPESKAPVIAQRRQSRNKLLVWAGGAIAALALTGGAAWWAHQHSASQTLPPDNADAPGLRADADINAAADEILSTPPANSVDLGASSDQPLEENRLQSDITPDVAPDITTPAPQPTPQLERSLEASRGNWPWNILEKRVAEKYGDESGKLTPKGRIVLAQMNAELLTRAAAETNFIQEANIPRLNSSYLNTVKTSLEAWGGWGTELAMIDGCSNLTELLGKTTPERATRLERALATTRLDSEEIKPLMQLAYEIPFPEEELTPTTILSPETPTEQGDETLSPYDAPDFPTHLLDEEKTTEPERVEPLRDPFKPTLDKPRRDPFEPYKLPADPTEPAVPMNLLREQNPNATPEEFGEILRNFKEGRMNPTKIDPPKLEQILKKHPLEEAVSTVSKKMRSLFGWASRKLEQAFA